MIKIELENDLKFDNYAIVFFDKLKKKAINDIAFIIQRDIEVNIAYGLSIKGGAVKPNKKRTRVLFKTGALFRSVRNEVLRSGDAYGRIIYLDPIRSEIGGWLHRGTSKMVARPFFGYSQRTLNKINSYLKNG